MKILINPVPIEHAPVTYSFDGDCVTVQCEDKTDTYDFTGMPDGVLNAVSCGVFDFLPIVDGKKVNGELYLELVEFAPYQHQPDYYMRWMDLEEYLHG